MRCSQAVVMRHLKALGEDKVIPLWKREERYSIDWLIFFFLVIMHTISADQAMKTVEADQEFNIFAVQLWYKGLIQKWILSLVHKSWGSVLKNSCCFQLPVWLSSRHSDPSVACLILYATSESENTEGFCHLLQNKLYRRVSALLCLFCGIRVGCHRAVCIVTSWTRERFWPLCLPVSQKWWEDAVVAGDVFFHLVCSAVGSHSTEGDAARSHLWWCWTQGSHYKLQRLHKAFLGLCLSLSHTQVHEGLGFALVREGIVDLLLFSGQAVEVWGWGCSVPRGVQWSCFCGRTVARGGTALHCCVWLYTCPKALHHLRGGEIWDMWPTVPLCALGTFPAALLCRCMGSWGYLESHYQSVTLPAWAFHLEKELETQKYRKKP